MLTNAQRLSNLSDALCEDVDAMTDDEIVNESDWEVGVVTAHPIKHALKMLLTIWRTWMHARKTGQDPTRWYGVYVKGTEIVIAHCGIGDGARQRAEMFVNTNKAPAKTE